MPFAPCAECTDEMCSEIRECVANIHLEAQRTQYEYIAKGVCSDCGACSLKDAERKYADLQDDQRRLQKKFDDLQKDLDKNAQDQSRLQKEIEAKKKILEEFKSGKAGKKG